MQKHFSVRRAKIWTAVLAVVFLFCLIIVLAIRGGAFSKTYTATGYVMGSYMQQTIYSRDGEAAAADALTRAAETEALISWRVEDSDIQKLNAAAGISAVPIHDRTRSILTAALDVAKQSGGAFDPTILPVSSLWNFDGEVHAVPSADQISKFLPCVSYQNLTLSSDQAFLQINGSAVDLGAAGKGAACDDAIAAYREQNATGEVVSVGGSIGLYGQKPDHTVWTIAVRDPRGEDLSAQLGTLDLPLGKTESLCISTSGSYEKAFTQDGVTYHHLLDPKTGYPAKSGLVSVTVLHESGLYSDLLATACFILGVDAGCDLLETYGASGIFVTKSGDVRLFGELAFTLTAEGYNLIGEE